jgi:DNA replication protein DnaC
MKQESESKFDDDLKPCSKCGGPTRIIVEVLGKKWNMPMLCECMSKKVREEEEALKGRTKQLKLKKLIDNSLMDKSFELSCFENWNHEAANEKMLEIAQRYVQNFEKVRSQNIGLLIYGRPGNGKTFTSACIGNALIRQSVPVICVGVISILQRIQKTFNNHEKEGADTILASLDNAELLILDDLGTEKESDWSRSMVYQIIDSRYRLNKPIIITTNVGLSDIKYRYDIRTYDRILEMCTPVENNHNSIRTQKARGKSAELKSMLGV